MKNIKKAIAECMSDFQAAENGGLNACFVFPEDFIGFQGHFPGNKILPGVCQIQCVLNMLEKWGKKRVVLKEVVLAKFLSPVSPLEKVMCACNIINAPDRDITLKAFFNKDGRKIAEVKLRVRFERETNER